MTLTPPFDLDELFGEKAFRRACLLDLLWDVLHIELSEAMEIMAQLGVQSLHDLTYDDVIYWQSQEAWSEHDDRFEPALFSYDEYDDWCNAQAAELESGPEHFMSPLDYKLAAMGWQHSGKTRRSNPRKFTRRGGRYRQMQDHGTTARRIGAMQSQQYRADRHSCGLYYWFAKLEKIARQARLADLAWQDYNDQLNDEHAHTDLWLTREFDPWGIDPNEYEDIFNGTSILDRRSPLHGWLPGYDDAHGDEDLDSPWGVFSDLNH